MRKRTLVWLSAGLGAAIVCLPTQRTAAWTPRPFFNSDGQFQWDLDTAGYPADNVIPYVINPSRPAGFEILPAGTTEEQIVDAIRGVFQAYENIPTSKLRFRFEGVDPTAQFSVDGILLVTLDFTDPGSAARARTTSD